MKTLVLVRHAKSGKKDGEMLDIDRPLTERGYREAYQMSDYLKTLNLKPDLLLTSSALRALNTAYIYGRRMKVEYTKIQISDTLYGATEEELLTLIQKLPAQVKLVFLVGHNPTFTALVNLLTQHGLDNLPTNGVACIDFTTDKWSGIGAHGGTLRFVVSPKTLDINLDAENNPLSS